MEVLWWNSRDYLVFFSLDYFCTIFSSVISFKSISYLKDFERKKSHWKSLSQQMEIDSWSLIHHYTLTMYNNSLLWMHHRRSHSILYMFEHILSQHNSPGHKPSIPLISKARENANWTTDWLIFIHSNSSMTMGWVWHWENWHWMDHHNRYMYNMWLFRLKRFLWKNREFV